MAFTEFYVQSGGSNVNAGSTTNNTAAVSVANASWDVTADTYIGLTGTEFAAVNVGDWASIYLDAATVAVYVAQVTAVGALGVSITLSTTAKYGTKPASGATGRSCKVGGAWASELPFASGGLGATTVPASTRINIKQATYTVVASRTFSIAGTTTAPLWFRGYNTTPGDCDANPTLAKPVFGFNATFGATWSGAHQTWSSVSVTGAVSGALSTISTNNAIRLVRCRIENTSANAAAFALSITIGGTVLSYCWFKTPTSGTTNGLVQAGNVNMAMVGCVMEGGGKAGFVAAAPALACTQCVFLNNTGNGWLFTGVALMWLFFNTVYNSTSDGANFAATPSATGCTIVGNLFSNCGGYGINNASGTNTNLIFRACNDFYACTSGNENGFGDSPSWFETQEVASPVTSATDMTLVATALGRAKGFAPGVFENQSFRSYVDAGAVQHADPVGGGQAISIFGG